MLARPQAGSGDPARLPYGVFLKLDGHGDGDNLEGLADLAIMRPSRKEVVEEEGC